MSNEIIINIIIGLILIGAIFLIIRELVCWYWKINEGIDLQKKSIKNQEKIIELLYYQQGLDKFDLQYHSGGGGGDKL